MKLWQSAFVAAELPTSSRSVARGRIEDPVCDDYGDVPPEI
jgi:hypothetical protein